jgi:hypothetical protein
VPGLRPRAVLRSVRREPDAPSLPRGRGVLAPCSSVITATTRAITPPSAPSAGRAPSP